MQEAGEEAEMVVKHSKFIRFQTLLFTWCGHNDTIRAYRNQEDNHMERYFNTEGLCEPDKHYMVRLDERLERIRRRYVERGSYFVINRGRQYGKTTTLRALSEYLKKDYLVFSMDFQEISTEQFRDETSFSRAFAKIFLKAFTDEEVVNREELMKPVAGLSDSREDIVLTELFIRLSSVCEKASKPIVMMIDEVDSASNNQVFLDFLALLRRYYLDRENTPAFHSVILAGVYDIKNLKLKIRPESEHKYNSPWNIAARFNVKMSFSTEQIAGMLQEYEADNRTGMDVGAVAEEIDQYTSGYPYLVSAICKLLDEELPETERFDDGKSAWSREGILEAVKILLKENIPLFDSIAKQLDAFPDLRDMIERIIYRGERVSYSPLVQSLNLGMMFGFLDNKDGYVVVSNRIFEMALLNMFITEEATGSEAFRYGDRERNQFIKDGRLNMDLVLEKFVAHYTDIYGDNDERFIEEYGRKFFLLYLKPIINGVGNYYMEAQTRDARRTDVIVDYKGEQFVVELKIWHGNEYNERSEEQLTGYLDYFRQKKGYLLSFNFNKNKQPGIKTIGLHGRTIVEAVV